MSGSNIRRKLILGIICVATALSFVAQIVYADSSAKDKLVVGVPTDRCPVFYIDDATGEIEGIGADLLYLAAENCDYEIEIQAISENNLKEALDNPEYDILMPFGSAITSASGKESITSDNLSQTPFTLVTSRQDSYHQWENLTVGMLNSLSGVAETVTDLYPGIEIVFYENMNDSVNALRAGEVDALLNNSYVWSYILQKPSYSDLYVQPSAIISMDFKIGALDTPEHQAIINRLNEGIAKITEPQRQAIVLDYTTRRLYKYDINDYLYLYGVVIVLGSLLFVSFVFIAILKQRSLREAQAKKLQFLINHDELTGVYSLNGFRSKVEELLKNNPDTTYFLSYNNIIDFKVINEKFGMNAGNELLKFWANISLDAMSDKEAMGRIVADQFVVLREVADNSRISDDGENILDPISNFFINQGKDYRVQICGGVYVLTPEDFKNIDVDRMLDCARIAEHRVHLTGKAGYEFYNYNHWESKKRTAEIVNHLSSALKSGEIQVWYQPQVSFNSNEIIGAEALCRWNHKTLGWISPGEFIPALESASRIYELDCFVWEKVCQDLKKWNQLGQKRTVSVNVSRKDIQENPNIHDFFRDLIRKYEISVKQLHIEITESAYAEDSDLLINLTNKLHDYGFQVEMDDFGSGYSSLNMLKEVSVDRIKLDLRFLADKGSKEKSHIIISHIIEMVKSLGMQIIAEGVETLEQADFLQNYGCVEMQGYLFYKPVPLQEFEENIGINHI